MILLRIFNGLSSRWRNFYYRFLGVELQGYVWMQKIEIPRHFSAIQIETGCALDRGVILLCSGDLKPRSKIYIGASTYINRNTFLDASESLTIGQQCAIGPNCYISDHDHDSSMNLPPLEQPLISKPTAIGDRVWLGANVTVLKGVNIGNDAVVGAGSVVTKNIPAGAIAIGNPARVIRYKNSMFLSESEKQISEVKSLS